MKAENLPAIKEAYFHLQKELRNKVIKDELLSRHTTLKVGGPASIYVIADTLDALRMTIGIANDFNLDYFVIGKGSNLLISDQGFKGIVIKLGSSFSKVSFCRHFVQAGAAVPLSTLVNYVSKRGFNDLVFAVGIPGSLGGALVSNAGAYGGTLGALVEEVKVFIPGARMKILDKEKLSFGYRTSSLAGQGIILEALLKVQNKVESEQIKREMKNYLERRKQTQPVYSASAGSIFKNPDWTSAGKLIEEAGCKGWRMGSAEISPIHANFIVNSENATSQEIYSLLKMVQERVYQLKKIHLELEITLVGNFT